MLFRSSWIILESEPILITSRLIGLLNVADKAALKLKGRIWLFWLFNAYPAELLVLNCAANGWFYCPALPADSGLLLNMEVVGTENDGWQRCQISRAGKGSRPEQSSRLEKVCQHLRDQVRPQPYLTTSETDKTSELRFAQSPPKIKTLICLV